MEKDEIEGVSGKYKLHCQAAGICLCWHPVGNVCVVHWELVCSGDRRGEGRIYE